MHDHFEKLFNFPEFIRGLISVESIFYVLLRNTQALLFSFSYFCNYYMALLLLIVESEWPR